MSPGTILIVGDSTPEQKSLVAALVRTGYGVVESADADEALTLVRNRRPELVICDLLMSGLDGYELVRRIRSQPEIAATRVIFCSSIFREEEALPLARTLGVACFLPKPLDPNCLVPTVARIIQASAPKPVPAAVLAALEEDHPRLINRKLMEKVTELERELAERKQVEAMGRESERRFAALVESAMDAIISVDAEQRIVLFNAAAEAMFQCPAPEALGSSIDRFIPARFRPEHAEHIRHFAETGTTSRAMGRLGALSGLRNDGVEFPIEASISQVELEGQRFFTVILRDISEKKRLEEALQRTNEDLERRVEERTSELMHANEALLRSNLELQRFAYVAAHDLQTPLRSISGFAQLLQKDYTGRLDAHADDLIRRVVENTQRMRTLIHDLLVYSRIDSLERPFRPIDLKQLFSDVVETLKPLIRELGAEVSSDDLPVVHGDRSQLVQVLHNLIHNGLKYHGSAPPRIHVGAKRQGAEWLLSVRDNGIGIGSRHHVRIFEVFRRLHTQQAYPGTGIGLAICRRVIEHHGGRIWVESEPGQGSVFYFTLPMASTENLQ